MWKPLLARVTGLEPATSGVTGRRSNQLSYTRSGRRQRLGGAGGHVKGYWASLMRLLEGDAGHMRGTAKPACRQCFDRRSSLLFWPAAPAIVALGAVPEAAA
jgi:hypothetical protein